MPDIIVARFEKPDELRTFDKGKFEVARIAGMTLGRATYGPGWKWSDHVGKMLGKGSCDVEHVGLVMAGRAAVAMDHGRTVELVPGDLFYIAPGHDSWVIGDDPYVSLHLMGVDQYAARERPDGK